MSRTFLGRSLCLCQQCVNTGSSTKMEHAQTCPNKSPPDVVALMTRSLMTQQPASPPDVYGIAVMTKSSSKVLGRFPTIKFITGRWLSYRKANSKRVRFYARKKFPGFDRGSGYWNIMSRIMSRTFWGRSLFMSQRCDWSVDSLPKHSQTCPNMQITTRCL
jgi:hypothetical protein